MQIWYSFHLTIPSFLQFNTNTDSGRFDLVFMISLDERSEIDEFGIQENDLSRIEHEKWNMMNNREFWRIRMKKSWFSWQFGDWRMRFLWNKSILKCDMRDIYGNWEWLVESVCIFTILLIDVVTFLNIR